MSLLQYLKVGNSLVAIKDAPSPYRLSKQGWLPKFEPATAILPDLDEKTVAKKSGKSPVETKPVIQNKGLKSGARSLRVWSVAPPPASEPAGPKTRAPLRQGELSLQKVKVVCNDLRESDIALVPRKAEARPAASAQQVEEMDDAKKSRSNWFAGLWFGTPRASA